MDFSPRVDSTITGFGLFKAENETAKLNPTKLISTKAMIFDRVSENIFYFYFLMCENYNLVSTTGQTILSCPHYISKSLDN
jgi:hypothetical protein